MTTRYDYAKNHAFHSACSNAVKLANSLEISLNYSAKLKGDIRRLKKASNYIASLIREADFDLIPKSNWDNMKSQADFILTHLNNFLNDKNENHIDQANGNLDELLKWISPYVVNGKGAAIGAGKAFKKLASDTENYIQSLSESYIESLDGAKKAKSDAEATLAKIEAFETKVQDLETLLFDNNSETPGFKVRVENVVSEIDNYKSEIENYKKTLVGDNEDDNSSIASQINNSRDKIDTSAKTAEDILSEVSSIVDDLKATHENVFGTKDENGNRVGGLKSEYGSFRKKLEEYHTKQKSIHAELNDQINQLLNDATTAGLATSYAYQKRQYKNPIIVFTWIFYGALFGLFLVAFSTILHIGDTGLTLSTNNTVASVALASVARFPFALPFIVLAFFAAKRRNENRRLQEEYAHKETIAKTYLSFKDQIEKIGGDEAKELSAKLLNAAIDTVSFNASKTLDKDHDDNLPSMDQIGNFKRYADQISDLIKS